MFGTEKKEKAKNMEAALDRVPFLIHLMVNSWLISCLRVSSLCSCDCLNLLVNQKIIAAGFFSSRLRKLPTRESLAPTSDLSLVALMWGVGKEHMIELLYDHVNASVNYWLITVPSRDTLFPPYFLHVFSFPISIKFIYQMKTFFMKIHRLFPE